MSWTKRIFFMFIIIIAGCGMGNTMNEEVDTMQKNAQVQSVEERPEAVNNGQLAKQYPDTVFLSGPKDEKKIALTFDDGPDPRVTGDLLDVLAEEKVPATFFLMGVRVDRYPDLVKRMVDEGHTIGSHGYWHNPLINLSNREAQADLEKANQAIFRAVNQETSLYRPPFGSLNEEKVEMLKELGYSVIIWSVDSEDWKASPPDEIAEKVIEDVRPGSIILHHDGANWNIDLSGTVTAVQKEIKELKKRGYTFVTVPELLGL
ncbi:polysaccharide deacetylase family protein [Alkalicoccobacillus porphyridii]|uniref:Polysaccharide deacetylase family protein n=1 Tax=Alkalicoccobacillus porphyridii TaxID=2597270 RepID=A0A553ZYN3_9BACI|nr:polysaccharide deacetylase family protein [Alkalicoccobacillus porphyridii]TSB46553.1 polysaccharide deacetylase family protein [Alkalicoccobacillus porphyridii]